MNYKIVAYKGEKEVASISGGDTLRGLLSALPSDADAIEVWELKDDEFKRMSRQVPNNSELLTALLELLETSRPIGNLAYYLLQNFVTPDEKVRWAKSLAAFDAAYTKVRRLELQNRR